MKKIYIIDYLGVHCGMHYYLEAFKSVLADNNFKNVKILSNYSLSETEEPFFVNQYKGSKLTKIIKLLINLSRVKTFINRNKDDVFIYLTYGNRIDIPFMKIISRANIHIVDIHEAIAQNIDNNSSLKQKFKELYKDNITAVISHSSRTDDFLKEYGYILKKFTVPHFKYIFPKNYDIENIGADILSAIDKKRINLLFFGNLSISKGVDILIESVNQLETHIADRLNVIIAGKDFDGAVDRITPKPDRHIKMIRRHINDDELRYLYQNVDYLSLPYRKTSQSGILEMAFYFKKPIIASDIPYFRKMLNEFPTFGILSGSDKDNYAATLKDVIVNQNSLRFYSQDDLDRYENRKEIKDFIIDLCNWLNIK